MEAKSVKGVINMSISGISIQNNLGLQVAKSASAANLKVKAYPADSVSFGSKEKDNFTSYSCKEADMLKYDLEYSKPSFLNGNYNISGKDIELEVKNTFFSGRTVRGNAYGKDVNLDLTTKILSINNGRVKGKIGDKEINLQYEANENAKNVKISGDFDSLDDKDKTLAIRLVMDKFANDYAYACAQACEVAMFSAAV